MSFASYVAGPDPTRWIKTALSVLSVNPGNPSRMEDLPSTYVRMFATITSSAQQDNTFPIVRYLECLLYAAGPMDGMTPLPGFNNVYYVDAYNDPSFQFTSSLNFFNSTRSSMKGQIGFINGVPTLKFTQEIDGQVSVFTHQGFLPVAPSNQTFIITDGAVHLYTMAAVSVSPLWW